MYTWNKVIIWHAAWQISFSDPHCQYPWDLGQSTTMPIGESGNTNYVSWHNPLKLRDDLEFADAKKKVLKLAEAQKSST